MDSYHKYGGLNGCIQGLEVLSGFHFLIKEGLHIIEGKYSKHVINETINTDTQSRGICCLEWRQAKNIMNFVDECMSVNTLIIDEFGTLEKRNSAIS